MQWFAHSFVKGNCDQTLLSNNTPHADARASAALCMSPWARAGGRERYGGMVASMNKTVTVSAFVKRWKSSQIEHRRQWVEARASTRGVEREPRTPNAASRLHGDVSQIIGARLLTNHVFGGILASRRVASR